LLTETSESVEKGIVEILEYGCDAGFKSKTLPDVIRHSETKTDKNH
jgi:hypothetical protein